LPIRCGTNAQNRPLGPGCEELIPNCCEHFERARQAVRCGGGGKSGRSFVPSAAVVFLGFGVIVGIIEIIGIAEILQFLLFVVVEADVDRSNAFRGTVGITDSQ
jgi:hypothetical protein